MTLCDIPSLWDISTYTNTNISKYNSNELKFQTVVPPNDPIVYFFFKYVSTVESSSSSFNGFPFAVVSPSIGRCVLSLSLAVVCIPFINGVTCNGQNVLPYLFIGLMDLNLVSTFIHLIRFDILLCLRFQIF